MSVECPKRVANGHHFNLHILYGIGDYVSLAFRYSNFGHLSAFSLHVSAFFTQLYLAKLSGVSFKFFCVTSFSGYGIVPISIPAICLPISIAGGICAQCIQRFAPRAWVEKKAPFRQQPPTQHSFYVETQGLNFAFQCAVCMKSVRMNIYVYGTFV